MNKLHRKDFSIAVKKGTDANKSKFAKEAVQGEMYYAMDSRSLYIANTSAGAFDSVLTRYDFTHPFNVDSDTEANILASTPTAPSGYATKMFGSDTGNFYIYDGNWYIFNKEPFNEYSLSFDGVDDQVNCGNITSLVSATAFSLSFWFKPVTQGVGASIGMRFNAQNQYAFYNNRFYLYTQPTGASLAYTPPADTNWHNYAVSYDAGSVSIYIDGVEVASATNFPTTLPIATLQDEFYIGSYGPLTGSYASEGSFDEVALFTTALSASDIASIYNGATPNDLTALSPEHWWRMGDNDGGTGTTITDQGSGGNNGTLVNGPTFTTDIPS
jgi:hypothetical protein